MRAPAVARNYAEALFELGKASGDAERYAELLDAIAGAVAAEPQIEAVLESPRVRKEVKLGLLERALEGLAPRQFVLFLQSVIRRGRQRLLGEMSQQYQDLLDIEFDRVHASVTIAKEPDKALQKLIADRLSTLLKKEVVPHFRTDPRLIGGMIVRVQDRIFDGSVRRKLRALRRAMLK